MMMWLFPQTFALQPGARDAPSKSLDVHGHSCENLQCTEQCGYGSKEHFKASPHMSLTSAMSGIRSYPLSSPQQGQIFNQQDMPNFTTRWPST
jgi:hypothetical protein